MRTRTVVLLAAGLALAGFAAVALAAQTLWTTSAREGMDAEDPQLVALGEEIYGQHCASCHGVALDGQPNWRERGPDGRLPAPPHDEAGHTWHHSDRQLFEITKYGVERFAPEGYESDMPAFEDVLTDEEIWAVLSFIKGQWPAEEREVQERINRAARQAEE